jgi:hypothetical protein
MRMDFSFRSADPGTIRSRASLRRRFTHLDADVQVFFSTGAQPIPDSNVIPALVKTKVALGLSAALRTTRVAPGGAVNSIRQLPLGKVRVTPVVVGVTTPAELSLWLALHELLDERAPPPRSGAAAAPDAYYVDGIAQHQAWFSQPNAGALENTAPAAPSAGVRPRIRGLRVEGFIAAGATGVTVQIVRGSTVIDLKRDGSNASSPNVTSVAASMQAPSGNRRGFSATMFLSDPGAAFGPVQILVSSSGGLTPPVVGAFTYHLSGAQVALVDDHAANPNGSAVGPVLGENNEVMILDYLQSPGPVTITARACGVSAPRILRT